MDPEGTGPLTWLVETKFHPPLLREDVIPRSPLLAALGDLLASHPLTLLSAPAGYGKTTLLASWAADCRSQVASLEDVAPLANLQPSKPRSSNLQPSNIQPVTRFSWLSLDDEDNDPVRFLAALIAALQRLDPACGRTAQTLLAGHANPGTEEWRLVSVLINDVIEIIADPFALVLDDLHMISEPAIFVALDYLLEHMPPHMHLLVATRVDPPLSLARLRARGQLAELRLSQLRFTGQEAMALLNDRMGLGLSDAEVQVLQARTEGWPVGLRLLADSLDRLPVTADRSAFIQHVLHTDRHVFDFLAEEVLNRQEPAVRTFLLETSILPELTAPLCQAVTARADAGELLAEIYRRNLFIAAIGEAAQQSSPGSGSTDNRLRDTGQRLLNTDHRLLNTDHRSSYRYHDLFADFLRHKLREVWPERVPELHLRAAQAEALPARAVSHYLAAASWYQAADLIEQIGAEMFTHGYLDTLSRWINALPGSVQESRPRLLHYLSNCAFFEGALDEVQSLLRRALQGFEAASDRAGQGEVLADLAVCAAARGEVKLSGDLFGQGLAYPLPPHTRVQALLGRALSRGAYGYWQETERDFNAAMALLQQAGPLDPHHLATFFFFHPGFAFLPGGLRHLERICRQARSQVDDQISPPRLMVEEMTTILHLFRGQLDQAIRSGESALALRERLGGHPTMALDAALYLIIAHAARGDYAAAGPLFEQLFLGVDQTDQPPADLPIYLFYAGRVRWLQACAGPCGAAADRPGRSAYLEQAGEIYERMCTLIDAGALSESPEVRICRAWMGSLLHLAEGHFVEAERALRRPEVLHQADRVSTANGCTRLMLARLYWQQDRQQEALAELAPALAYHQKLGIPFPILVEGQSIVPLLRLAVERGLHERYAAHLLDLLARDDWPRPLHVPHTGETLTPREVEVLGLVVAAYSNRAIAAELVISEWTVKSHLTKIYRKLDVSSRTEAIARARDLQLLP